MEKHQDSHDRLVIALLALIVLALIYIGIRLTPMHHMRGDMYRHEVIKSEWEKPTPDSEYVKEEDNVIPAVPSYTVSQLINKEQLSNVSCDTNFTAQVRDFTIVGYVYASDVTNINTTRQVNIRDSANMNSQSLFLKINKATDIEKLSKETSSWIKVRAHGNLQHVPLAMQNNCILGFGLGVDMLTILK